MMTVYVDTDHHFFCGKKYHYLFVDERNGDTVEELNTFARGLGLRQHLLRDGGTWKYYEVNQPYLRRVLGRGAVPVSGYRVIAIVHGPEALQRMLKNMGHNLYEQ